MTQLQQGAVYPHRVTPLLHAVVRRRYILAQESDVVLYDAPVYHLCDMMADPGNILRARDGQYRQLSIISLG